MLSLLSLSNRVTISSCVHSSSSCCCCSSTILFINTSTSIAPSTNWRRETKKKAWGTYFVFQPYINNVNCAMSSILTKPACLVKLSRKEPISSLFSYCWYSYIYNCHTCGENTCSTHLLPAVLVGGTMRAAMQVAGWWRLEGVTSDVVGFRV